MQIVSNKETSLDYSFLLNYRGFTMSRKKQQKTQNQQMYEKYVRAPQPYERVDQSDNQFFRIFVQMVKHPNYLSLSGSAIKIYTIMRAQIWENIKDYSNTREISFSSNEIERKGIMSKKTCIKALRELEHYGFIEKANNAMYQSGYTQRWKFSDEWGRKICAKFKE